MSIIFLQKDRGGTLSHYVGRAVDSSYTPTVTLLSSGGSTIVASQNATKGPRTTLDAAAAADQKTVPLTATTDIAVGDHYLLTNATSQTETVVIDSITSGVSVGVRTDLRYTYASADVFQSLKISVSVSAAQATGRRSNARAQWVYESGSQEHMEESLFFISKFAPTNTCTEADIQLMHPRIYHMLAADQDLDEIIKFVWDNRVLLDFAGRYDPRALISASALKLATVEAVVAEIASANEQWEEWDARTIQYKVYLEQALSATAIDADLDGDFDDADEGLKMHPYSLRIERA